tara:strand:- start:315 stop:638 length:324 start_codon:yes stop_codon:yes gene_type:complete
MQEKDRPKGSQSKTVSTLNDRSGSRQGSPLGTRSGGNVERDGTLQELSRPNSTESVSPKMGFRVCIKRLGYIKMDALIYMAGIIIQLIIAAYILDKDNEQEDMENDG